MNVLTLTMHCCCCCCVTSVVSDSVRPHRGQPTRLPRPWDSPGKDTGVGCPFLLRSTKGKVKVKSLSPVRLLATPWTGAYQSPPSMGFSRREYWSGVPLPFLRLWDFPSESTEVGCHCLLLQWTRYYEANLNIWHSDLVEQGDGK